jgi:hypothetical protein
LIDDDRKWNAEAYCPVLRCTSPRLYEIIHSNGSKYSARFRHAIACDNHNAKVDKTDDKTPQSGENKTNRYIALLAEKAHSDIVP